MRYLLPFIVAMLVAVAGLPVLVRLAGRWLLLDKPGGRKVHLSPIPRVGGLAMACGVLVAAFVALNLTAQDRWFLLAAGVLTVFGALDDRFDLDYRIKLTGQLLAVVIVATLGHVQIRSFTLDDRVLIPQWLSMPLTVIFLVGVTNAINLADGLDGLAGGTTFLCLCAIAVLSRLGDPGASTALALTFAGAVLGFLRFNTYPATVFMGDAGSQLLGFATGVLSVRITQAASSQLSAALPVLLLALPILDTLCVMVQRVGEGRSPFSADKNHIHHKLLALGFHQHEAVMVIYMVQGALFVIAYFLRYDSDLWILGVVSVFFAASIAIMQFASHAGWRLRHPDRGPHGSAIARLLTAVGSSHLLPGATYVAIAAALGTYAVVIVKRVNAVSPDIRVLLAALLATAIVALGILRVAPLSIIEKASLYVTATVLVYFDELIVPPSRPLSIIEWIAVCIAAVATVIRLRLFSDRRFELTPLDLIVLFMALVVPNLPGSLGLPHGGALAIAKLVVVFYAVEMLISRSEHHVVWLRVATAGLLASLILRSLATA